MSAGHGRGQRLIRFGFLPQNVEDEGGGRGDDCGVRAEQRRSEQEGQRLTQTVRRSKGGSIRVRRATMIMASASGTPVPAIARLVAADEDTVRDVIHAFQREDSTRWTLSGREAVLA